MSHEHEGYDIESEYGHGEIARYIEVKANGRSVGLTRRRHVQPAVLTALRSGDEYWLYVVEYALVPIGGPCMRSPTRPARLASSCSTTDGGHSRDGGVRSPATTADRLEVTVPGAGIVGVRLTRIVPGPMGVGAHRSVTT
jgi:hypothetical protein